MKVFVNRKYPLEKKYKNFDNNNYQEKQLINKKLLLSLILIFICLYYFFFNSLLCKKEYSRYNNDRDNINKIDGLEINEFYPENYQRYIINRIRNRLKGPIIMDLDEFAFVNGLIRKFRPKKILEIGVCSGGMSAVILNAIMDIKDSFLYSCDLEVKHYLNSQFEVGCVVKNNFPEFLDKWKLFTGNTTAAFIEGIGNNIDFVFIDTAHVMPGEVLNMIEILPFLKKNAIIAFDDIDHQVRESLFNVSDFYPCNNLLFSVLRGKKIIYNQKNNNIFNFRKLGAVILDNDQENYFFEYFYLLSNNWSYMPNKFEIDLIRRLVEKYYKPYFLSMFDRAIELNYEKLKRKGLYCTIKIYYT